jgi:hypothetical protein
VSISVRQTGTPFIEVCDEHKQRVLTMTVSLAIEQPDDGSRPWIPWGA